MNEWSSQPHFTAFPLSHTSAFGEDSPITFANCLSRKWSNKVALTRVLLAKGSAVLPGCRQRAEPLVRFLPDWTQQKETGDPWHRRQWLNSFSAASMFPGQHDQQKQHTPPLAQWWDVPVSGLHSHSHLRQHVFSGGLAQGSLWFCLSFFLVWEHRREGPWNEEKAF